MHNIAATETEEFHGNSGDSSYLRKSLCPELKSCIDNGDLCEFQRLLMHSGKYCATELEIRRGIIDYIEERWPTHRQCDLDDTMGLKFRILFTHAQNELCTSLCFLSLADEEEIQ